LDTIINIEYYFIAIFAALWIMLPAYVPNPIAALCGGGTPIDRGRTYPDGRRILGDGKTFRGFIIGIGSGILVGMIQITIQSGGGWSGIPDHTPLSITLLSIGALSGDLAKSFIKRRLGKERGERWNIADQYDLVAGALLLNVVFNLNWLISAVSLIIFLWILILTPFLHYIMNIIGYLTGIKDVPW